MATKKTNTTTRGKRTKDSAKSKMVEPDLTLFLDEDSNFELDLYDKGNYISAKLTCCGIFVVYARVVVVEDDEYAFVAFPSYYREGKKGKKGEYVNQAFFIDSDIIKTMNTAVTKYCFSEE